MSNGAPTKVRNHRLDRCGLIILAILGAAFGWPTNAAGQMVQGTLVEQDTGMPIEGAAIVALAPDDRRLAWTLTDAAGRFFFRLDAGGSFVLRADRIGHVSMLSEDLRVGVGDTLVYRMETQVEAIELGGLLVEGSGRDCEIRPEEGVATARVWEEARKALEAAAQTSKRGTYQFMFRRFERQLDERGRRVLSETSHIDRRFQARPFQSLEASRLIEEGFVQPDGDGWLYYAPDADVLLSDEFLDSHCLRLSEGRVENEGLLGLEFEPTRDRDVPEISGTLWIEPASAELRRIEYRYENLGFSTGRSPIGGTVGFAGLPNGTWFVSTWSIRMPTFGQESLPAVSTGGVPQIRRIVKVVGIHEEGALVLQVHDVRGDLVVESGAGTIEGTVMWEDSGHPVTGAVVTMRSNGYNATTGADGRFRLGGLGDGIYDVRVSHPTLGELGYGGQLTPVQAVSGQVTSVRLTLPGEKRVLVGVCIGPGPDKGGVVSGWVRHAETGEPIPDAVVGISSTVYTVVGEALVARKSGVEAFTRDDGFFIYCGTRMGGQIDIEVNAEGMKPWTEVVEVSGDHPIAHITVLLAPKGTER